MTVWIFLQVRSLETNSLLESLSRARTEDEILYFPGINVTGKIGLLPR